MLTDQGRDYLPELSAGFDLLGESTARVELLSDQRSADSIQPRPPSPYRSGSGRTARGLSAICFARLKGFPNPRMSYAART